MTRRLIILSALVATAVSAPALAFAFGGFGPGGGCNQQGFGPMGGPMGGRAALTQEALKTTTVTLDQAIAKAQENVSGTVAMAHLVPFSPALAQGNRNAFATPALHPTYMVALVDGDTRTMVTVDGATAESVVAGSASGIMAMGRGGMAMGMGMGGRGFPADMSTAKISPSDAVAKAVAATNGGTATMVRGVQRGNDTAWMTLVQPTDGTGLPSMVFIDPDNGEVLRIQEMPLRGGRQIPGMGAGMGQGRGMGMGPGLGQGMGQGMGQGQGMGPGMGQGMGQGMGMGMGPCGTMTNQ